MNTHRPDRATGPHGERAGVQGLPQFAAHAYDQPTTTPTGANPTAPQTHWTGGRVVSMIAGVLLLMGGFGIATGGATLAWADQTQRDKTG